MGHNDGVPFYVAVPGRASTWSIDSDAGRIPIEQRPATEVSLVTGRAADGSIISVQVTPTGTPLAKHAFDVKGGP